MTARITITIAKSIYQPWTMNKCKSNETKVSTSLPCPVELPRSRVELYNAFYFFKVEGKLQARKSTNKRALPLLRVMKDETVFPGGVSRSFQEERRSQDKNQRCR
ncbi:unnamed protein product [Amoebophrya sp. A120]|nr:unnamed protein product [Amoebophrya sp. A120]|eukprot:GSA120T00012885001.1